MDLSDDVSAIDSLLPSDPMAPDAVTTTGSGGLSSAFAVNRLLGATAAHAVAAGDALIGRQEPRSVDVDQVAAFCTTTITVDGVAPPVWADLSGMYATADDRAIQLHCNFPHHAEGVVDLLGSGHDRDAVAAEIARRPALELEDALVERGLVGAVVRTLDEWDAHPHARATNHLPLVDVTRLGDAEPGHAGPDDALRVLDCSRVLAGPVAGQLLAGLGHDVMRLGAAHLPSVDVGVLSTGFGKRNAFADLRTDLGRRAMDRLLADCDVWIDAFRPGAMQGFGYSPEAVAERRPGIVVVQISAFDWTGPWAGRRGYDSIVQSTTGVRWAGGEFAVDGSGAVNGPHPVGLPVQALDYSTGFLAAGVAARLVTHQRRAGGSWLARVSLLRTRHHLLALDPPKKYTPTTPVVSDDRMDSIDSDFGRVTAVRPFAGSWHWGPRRLGADPAEW